MRADLHTHSWYSDGTLSPEALVARAADCNIQYLAITDHDSTGAWQSLTPQQVPDGLMLVPGVEISTLWEGREIHIVGLFVNDQHPGLTALLQQHQELRRIRAQAIADKLAASGITGLMAHLDTLPCQAISRNHIADFLIERGLAGNKQQAFSKLLGARGRYRAPAQWCDIGTACRTLVDAGGLAVLAHPDRYRLTGVRMNRLLSEFSEAGGEAMEVSYSNLNPDKLAHLGDLCEAHRLWASIGSDFHTPDREWMDIGKIRHLPRNCRERAVWHHPLWQATLSDAA